jgi:hypothetical protein
VSVVVPVKFHFNSFLGDASATYYIVRTNTIGSRKVLEVKTCEEH